MSPEGGAGHGAGLNVQRLRADLHDMRERRRDTEGTRVIPCRACGELLELDPERIQRFGGRTFIECGSCVNYIWIRRSDFRRAVLVGAPSTEQAAPGHAGDEDQA